MQPVIIGAGIAGMSAALHLAQKNIPVTLVAPYPSVRSQSVMAEGGINAAIGPDDSPSLHFRDTWESGCRLANIKAVHHLTDRAPEVIGELQHLAMAFTLGADGKPALRPFGGQSVNRTAHADSTTGKQLVTALIYELRRYEEEGLVNRLTGFFFLDIDLDEGNVRGVLLYNRNRKKTVYIRTSQLIIAAGGLNGLFGNTTGSVANTGDVTARLFTRGVTVANAELVQYHPTTFRRPGKNMLISEAVRGAGGRLFTEIGGKRLYFMEEKFGPKGNLQPRDVVSREEYRVVRDLGGEIFLDCTGIPKDTFITSLSGFAGDCREYFNIDPTTTPLPVRYGIHYFMGGIYTDPSHRTSVGGLYSAGENPLPIPRRQSSRRQFSFRSLLRRPCRRGNNRVLCGQPENGNGGDQRGRSPDLRKTSYLREPARRICANRTAPAGGHAGSAGHFARCRRSPERIGRRQKVAKRLCRYVRSLCGPG